MLRRHRLRLTLLVVVLLVAPAAGSPAGAAATVRPVLTTSQFLDDLRFDDSRLAWVQSAPSSVCGFAEGNTVYRYSFVTGTRTRLTNPWCNITSTGYFGRLVLAGKRVYWAQSEGGNTQRTWSLWTTADPGSKTRLIRREVDCGAACSCLPSLGTDLGPTEGTATTFLFSSHDLTAGPTCVPGGGDQGIVTASRLTRVTAGPSGLQTADVPGAPGAPSAQTIAYAAGRVALVQLENGEPPLHVGDTVEIRDVATGALVSQFSPTGSIKAIALSQSAVVVLVRGTNGESRIEHRSVATGALKASWPVRKAIFPSLDIHGARIVYRIAAEIRVLRIDTGRSRLLHRVTSPTFFTIGDVQIEGNRVVWRVRTQGRSTVYQLILP